MSGLILPVRRHLPDLTPNFSWAEVEASATASARGIPNLLPHHLEATALYTALRMEQVRARLNHSVITITSWYRSPALNVAVGSTSRSAHLLAAGVDFLPRGWILEEALDRLASDPLRTDDQLIIETDREGRRWIHAGWMAHPRRNTLVGAWNAALKKMTFRQRLAPG